MEKVKITREGVTREIRKKTWLEMVKEKATYGWQVSTAINAEVKKKEAEIVKSTPTKRATAKPKEAKPVEVKPKGTKAQTNEK